MPIYVQARDFPQPLTVQITQPNGRRRTTRGRVSRLGSITPDAAAQTAMPKSAISGKAGFTQSVYDGLVRSAQTGNFDSFNPGGCTGQAPTAAKLSAVTTAAGQVIGKIALQIAPATGPLAPIVAGVAVALNIFGALFAHHAAAVAKERQVVCAAVPAAADALTAIQQAVQNGTVSPSDGIAMLQNLLNSFKGQVASIIKMSPSQCNAACVWVKQLTAITAELSSQYQDLAVAQGAAPGGAFTAGGAAAATNWLPIAAVAAGVLFFAMR